MLTLDKIYHAAFVLKPVVRQTALIPAAHIAPDCSVYLKTENLQVTGSFKVRGAYYKISQLTAEEKAKGVIACSAGNHAQGVALAATKAGISSLICLPDGAPISKVEATKRYGAQVCLVKGVYDDAYQRALQLKEETGAAFIHPFDDEDVIAGQGTIGLEILDQLPDVEAVVVPIGGGGLISGVAFAVKHLRPDVKVYGVQAAGAASMQFSLQQSVPTELNKVRTVADGIKVKKPGDLTYELCRQYVDEVVTVTDDEIATAILTLMEQEKVVSEGAGAVAAAAVMFGKVPTKGQKTVCVISGGNIDVTILNRVISRGLMKTGRNVDMTVELVDKPGQLTEISGLVAQTGANVVGVYHDRADEGMEITSCLLRLVMETRDHAHIEEIRRVVEAAGYHIISIR